MAFGVQVWTGENGTDQLFFVERIDEKLVNLSLNNNRHHHPSSTFFVRRFTHVRINLRRSEMQTNNINHVADYVLIEGIKCPTN